MRAQAPPGIYAAEFSATNLSAQDDQFLEELEKANFQFFWEQADPETGLVKDRCNVARPTTKARWPASPRPASG